MELSKAIEAAALAGMRKERAEISKQVNFWRKKIPLRMKVIEENEWNYVFIKLTQLTKRLRALDAILKGN